MIDTKTLEMQDRKAILSTLWIFYDDFSIVMFSYISSADNHRNHHRNDRIHSSHTGIFVVRRDHDGDPVCDDSPGTGMELSSQSPGKYHRRGGHGRSFN